MAIIASLSVGKLLNVIGQKSVIIIGPKTLVGRTQYHVEAMTMYNTFSLQGKEIVNSKPFDVPHSPIKTLLTLLSVEFSAIYV